MIAMTTTFIRLAVVIGVAAALAGCATPPPPDPRAEVPYCHKSNKGRVLACEVLRNNHAIANLGRGAVGP